MTYGRSSGGCHGGSGGTLRTFNLASDEYITRISGNSGREVDRVSEMVHHINDESQCQLCMGSLRRLFHCQDRLQAQLLPSWAITVGAHGLSCASDFTRGVFGPFFAEISTWECFEHV